jgi:drug/metabolite transporter (DMT)-like permease
MGAAAGLSASASSLIASLVMLVGCVAAASSDIVAKTLTGEKWRMQSTSIVLIFFCLSALMLLPVMPFIWQTPDLRHVGLLAVVGVAGVTFQLLLTRALSLSKASAIAPFSYTSLIWATMLGFAFWKDLPAGSELLGVLFIVADGLLAWYTNREKDLSRFDAGTVSKSLSGVDGSRLQSRRAKSLYRTKRRKEKKRIP